MNFFKRLILVILALLILIPTGLAIYFGVRCAGLGWRVKELETAVQRLPSEAPGQLGSVRVDAEPIDYQELYPDLYGPAEIPADRDLAENTVYLTFDGSPSPNTEDILDVLDEYGVKATFFVMGYSDADSLALLKDISNRGHTIGLYSYSDSLQEVYSSVTAYLDDFNQFYRLVYETTGERPQLFRFPAGSVNSYNSGFYQELIAEMLRRNFVFFDWNVSGESTQTGNLTAEQVCESVLEGMENTSRGIVKLQDSFGKEAVAEALPSIIQELKSAGYRFEPLTAKTLPVIFSYKSAP